jgi:hypothetical protein
MALHAGLMQDRGIYGQRRRLISCDRTTEILARSLALGTAALQSTQGGVPLPHFRSVRAE